MIYVEPTQGASLAEQTGPRITTNHWRCCHQSPGEALMEGTRDALRGGLSPVITWKVSPEEERVQRRPPSSKKDRQAAAGVVHGCLQSFCPSLIGCHTGKAHPLQPEINKHAPQFKCHHLLCNMASLCVCVCMCVQASFAWSNARQYTQMLACEFVHACHVPVSGFVRCRLLWN